MEVGQPFEPQVQLWLDGLHSSAGLLTDRLMQLL